MSRAPVGAGRDFDLFSSPMAGGLSGTRPMSQRMRYTGCNLKQDWSHVSLSRELIGRADQRVQYTRFVEGMTGALDHLEAGLRPSTVK